MVAQNLFHLWNHADANGDAYDFQKTSDISSDSFCFSSCSSGSDNVIMTMKVISSFGTSSSSNRVTLIRQQRAYFKKPSLSH